MKINEKQVFLRESDSLRKMSSLVTHLMKEFPETVVAIKGKFYVELNEFFPISECEFAIGEYPKCTDIHKVIKHSIYTAMNDPRIEKLFEIVDSKSIKVTDFEFNLILIYGNSKIEIASSMECGYEYMIIDKEFK